MTFTSVGYDGTVTEQPWSVFSQHLGGLYHVGDDVNAFKPTIAGAGDRALTIAAGSAYGLGVFDTSDDAIVKNLAAVSSGSRWDLISLRRDWSSNTSSIEITQGGTTKALPTRFQGFPKDDQPLALARVASGSTAVQEIVDLRVWGLAGGVLVARDNLVMSYLTAIGTVIRIGDAEYTRIIDPASGTATWSTRVPNVPISTLAPTSTDGSDGSLWLQIIGG